MGWDSVPARACGLLGAGANSKRMTAINAATKDLELKRLMSIPLASGYAPYRDTGAYNPSRCSRNELDQALARFPHYIVRTGDTNQFIVSCCFQGALRRREHILHYISF